MKISPSKKSRSILETHLDAMTDNILNSGQAEFSWNGWKRVPTIKSMEVHLGRVNAFLEQVGLARRVNTKLKFRMRQSDAMNRYIKHQLIRAEKCRKGEPKLFWTIAHSCIKNSVSFRVSAYNRVFPQWWHEESMSQVWMKLKRIQKLIISKSSDLLFTRCYIPKGDTFRPLGVPSGEWRVVMHMHNNWLTMYLRPTLEKFNHAYLPGKGALTAWKELITKALKYDYIYEFDLKQFFPSVDVEKVTEILQKKKVPKWYTYMLENINRTIPKLPKELKLDESQFLSQYKLESNIRQGIFDTSDSVVEVLRRFPREEVEQLVKEDGESNLFEWIQMQWVLYPKGNTGNEIRDTVVGEIRRILFKNLPQGLNTSPTLSILTLEDWVEKYRKRRVYSVMYADDGILYSNRPFKPFSQEGAEIHEEKSRWLKWNGKWRVESFKFLGITYLVKKGIIKGSTRNGSTLEFTENTKGVFDLIRFLKPDYEKTDMELLANSNIFGLVMSHLYTGTWTELIPKKTPWISHPKSWWGKKNEMKGSATTSSVAAEVLAKIVGTTMNRP